MKNAKIDRETPVPLHYQIRRGLEKRIRGGHPPVGGRLPSENELMETFKVSRFTVRKALDDLEAMGLVRRSVGKGTFVADGWQGGELSFVVLLPTPQMINDPRFMYHFINYDILKGVSDACRDYSVKMQILYALNDLEGCRRGVKDLERLGNVNGIVFSGHEGYEPLCQYAADRHIPRVLVTHEVDPPELARVRADSYGGACELMEHLVSLGHRRIALLHHKASRLERYRAYHDVLGRHAIAVEPSLLVGGDMDEAALGAALLSLPERPTAVFATNDIMAMKFVATARERGLRVPEDVSVAGFDDMPGAAEFAPPLTTVRIDNELIGYEAVRVLRRWNADGAYVPALHQVRTSLVVRASCLKAF